MTRLLAASIAILLLTAACATAPRRSLPPSADVVVLLADDQGKTGAIAVSGRGGEKILTKPGEAVIVEPGAPPGEPFILSGREVRALVAPAVNALPKQPAHFILHFKHDSVELTRESLDQIPEILRVIRERAPVDVSVVGHTDTVGDKPYNYQLSLKRAKTVAAILVQSGVDRAILDITSHGKDNPLVPTGDQVSEPRNRRVEVTVR